MCVVAFKTVSVPSVRRGVHELMLLELPLRTLKHAGMLAALQPVAAQYS